MGNDQTMNRDHPLRYRVESWRILIQIYYMKKITFVFSEIWTLTTSTLALLSDMHTKSSVYKYGTFQLRWKETMMTESFSHEHCSTEVEVMGHLNEIKPVIRASDASIRSQVSNASSVGFGNVEIREFERICGDHPDVHDAHKGPPLAIGWRYYDCEAVPVEFFEETRRS